MLVLRPIVGFIVGFVLVYAVAMGLAVLGFSWFAGQPYERLLAWMGLGGVLGACAPMLKRRRA